MGGVRGANESPLSSYCSTLTCEIHRQVNSVDVNQKERQREMAASRTSRLAELNSAKKEKKKTKGRSKVSQRCPPHP